MSNHYDRIITSKPVNKTAGLVMSGGVGFDDRKQMKDTDAHWEAPPPVIAPEKYPTCSSFSDLRGIRFGRMTVIGFLGRLGSQNAGTRWLARCDCGDYEARSAKVIKNTSDADHSCMECNYNRKLKYGFRKSKVAA